MSYNKNKTVIVYLAMNTKKDILYNRDSRSMLEKSIDSLYKNYNNTFRHDIIIFYDSKFPFLEKDQQDIIKNRSEISFKLLSGDLWSLPNFITLNSKDWIEPHVPVGYRHMIRWYGILIYKYLIDLGYEWYVRLDDDSLIHSEINYDMFKFMYDNNYEYGFRAYSNDHIMVSNNLIELCDTYIKKNNITPTFLNRFTREWKTKEYNILGYYNNFLVSKLSFWINDDVQKFLKEIDNSGYIYTKRWGDLIIQAVTIQIFMNRNKLYHFNDWCYEHVTLNKNHIICGGLYPKIENSNIVETDYSKKWKEKYNTYHDNSFHTLNIKDCITITNQDIINKDLLNNCEQTYVKKLIKTPTGIMPIKTNKINANVIYLGLYDNIEDVYNRIHDHWLNCSTTVKRSLQFEYDKPYAFLWYNNKLYVINNKDLLTISDNSICFVVNKSIIIEGGYFGTVKY